MTLETLVSSLTRSEKLQVMELIWQDLSQRAPEYASPTWHEQVLQVRERNPLPEKPLGLDEAKAEVRVNFDAGDQST